MSELQFRIMDKADLPIVTKIESDCQSFPWTLLQFLDGFNAGHEGWVACMDIDGREMIIGFAVISTVLDESTLMNLCVRPAFQNQGFGRALLEHLLARARRDNIRNFFLEVRVSNKTAIHLYEAVGFEQISVRKDYYPSVVEREDGLVYSLSPLLEDT